MMLRWNPSSGKNTRHNFAGIVARPEQEPVFAIFCSLSASMVWSWSVVNATRVAILIPPMARLLKFLPTLSAENPVPF